LVALDLIIIGATTVSGQPNEGELAAYYYVSSLRLVDDEV